jgi:hypothetical protein
MAERGVTMAKKTKLLSPARVPTSLEFFGHLKWIDGRPLIKTVESYRQKIFTAALDTFDSDGRPKYNMVVAGRAKKNWKSADLVMAGLYKLVIPHSPQGSDGFILANDEGQAADDLSLAKKLVAVNADLDAELEVLQKEIRRRDGRGALKILPARDAVGAHGKTASFIGYDEIHGFKNYDLLEALAPDPTRQSTITWVTSYDTIYAVPGVPLHDLKQIGFAGSDPRMLFSWYSGDRTTDPDFADLPPERRANPSMASWDDGIGYIEQQRRRLPTHKFRRLHLNLPGSPNGAAFDQGIIIAATVAGRKALAEQEGIRYHAFVDMSGGSSDDAVLGIAHVENNRAVLDLVAKQTGPTPFNPRDAVSKFVGLLWQYGLTSVTGDAYAGLTFSMDFQERGIQYQSSAMTKAEIYDAFEPMLNAAEVELLDVPDLQEQFVALVVRGGKIDHEPGGHDDWSNAAAGALVLAKSGGGHTQYSITGIPVLPVTEFDDIAARIACDGNKWARQY